MLVKINEQLIIDKSKDNYDIARIKKDLKWIYLGSKYNMKNEIDKFLDVAVEKVARKEFIIFGFCAGEHIKELRNEFKEANIIIYEPNKDIFAYANKLDFVKHDDKIYIKDNINDIIHDFVTEFKIKKIKIIPFGNYDRIYDKEYLELLKLIKDKYIDLKIDENTKRYFSERWFETLFCNLKYAAEAVWIDEYKDEYKDKPAIIVSAGPSVDKNIDLLKGIEENFFIITGGRPFKGLVDKGIKAQLMVNIDASEENYKLIENCTDELDIPLLFFEVTNEKIVQKHHGIKLFSTFNPTISQLFEFDNEYLEACGSVAHTMTSTAILLGCNPIIFVGQDCAYTNDKAHSPFLEQRHKDALFDDVKNNTDIWVDDINGGKVRTSRSLNSFRLKIEKIIENHPNNIFINATEGGARIKGTIEMTMQEVIDKYGDKTVAPLECKKYDVNKKEELLKELEKTKSDMNFIKIKLKESLKITDKLEKVVKLKKDKQIDDKLNKLNKLDKCILNKIESFGLTKYLLYPIIYNILSNEFEEDTVSIVKKSRSLYEALEEANEKGINAIDSVLTNKVDNIKKLNIRKEMKR